MNEGVLLLKDEGHSKSWRVRQHLSNVQWQAIQEYACKRFLLFPQSQTAQGESNHTAWRETTHLLYDLCRFANYCSC